MMSASAKKQRRILVIEGDDKARETISTTLKRAGYTVVETAHSDQAVILLGLDRHPSTISTILCDIRTSKIKGIEAVSYFRVRYPSIPVIVLTTYSDIEWAIMLMKRGAADYLIKPVSRDDLLTVLRTVCHRSVTVNSSLPQ